MAQSPGSQLTVPLRAEHVREALAVARADSDEFRRAEMNWLEKHFSILWLTVTGIFEDNVRRHGLEVGEAIMAGTLLGNLAVRRCLGDEDFEIARKNFQHNNETELIKARTRGGIIEIQPWGEEAALQEMFGDKDLVASILEIRHASSRNTAAVTLVYLCFEGVPKPTSVSTE